MHRRLIVQYNVQWRTFDTLSRICFCIWDCLRANLFLIPSHHTLSRTIYVFDNIIWKFVYDSLLILYCSYIKEFSRSYITSRFWKGVWYSRMEIYSKSSGLFYFWQISSRWVLPLNSNISSLDAMNGFSSISFKIESGVRQGCSLSPFYHLFWSWNCWQYALVRTIRTLISKLKTLR